MKCIEKGCTNEAGTPWGPHWCLPCDKKRLARITKSMEEILVSFSHPKDRESGRFVCSKENPRPDRSPGLWTHPDAKCVDMGSSYTQGYECPNCKELFEVELPE